jgi:D-amino-acid dehydrogenase
MTDVLVVGGGIVGASAAYHLARNGVAVTLVDRGDEGVATAAGAGIIAPATNLDEGGAGRGLMDASVGYYHELLDLLAEDGETDTGYAVVGALVVAESVDEVPQVEALARFAEQRERAGATHIGRVTQISGGEAQALFPVLGPFPAALHVTGSARVDGRLMRAALHRAAVSHGARIVHGGAVVHPDGEGRARASLNGDAHNADTIILAAGAWTKALAAPLGVEVPVFPQRGQILHMDMPDGETAAWPIVLGFHGHYLLTFPTHRVVAGATRELDAGFDPRVTVGGVHEVTGQALRVAPGLARATVREVRVGLRPASPDGLPMLGGVPGFDNVYVATGHGPSGLQLGPYSGVLVADLVMGAEAALDLAPFSVERFN